ncbi:unnamed protein product [Orchesella dallaii]|uniref:Uncharacterized protein n=1 Tax=Orchesella dallaii TaxID=48710 RepID=A0ABP1RH11_9HEXA
MKELRVPGDRRSDAGVEPIFVTTPAKSGNVEQDGATPAPAAENTSKPEGEKELAVNTAKLDQHISSNF